MNHMALYAFDGTWKVRDHKQVIGHVQSPQYGVDRAAGRDTIETNVSRFREFYGEEASAYQKGVGTGDSWIDRALGGLTGLGGMRRVRKMYRELTLRYFEQGDTEIDLVGFSRGSALAIHFANVIADHGLRNPKNSRHLAWWRYPGLGWTFRHPKPSPSDVKAPPISFLGLFDTVASFGLPVKPFRNRTKKWRVREIPRNVRGTFHAMALDEVRTTFELVRPQLAEPPPEQAERETLHPHETPTLYEVWFRGAHSNIGGGYPDRGLSDTALAWMMEQAVYQWRKMERDVPPRIDEALRMLDPDRGPRPDWRGLKLETLEPDPDGLLGRPPRLHDQAWRALTPDLHVAGGTGQSTQSGPLVHHSVYRRRHNLVSDYGTSNLPLLRPVPRDARTVYDPPHFYTDSRKAFLQGLADEAFGRVPVRPAWLKHGDYYVLRSDRWIALGTELGRLGPEVERTSKQTFVDIALAWLLAGRPTQPDRVPLPPVLMDHHGKPIDDPAAVRDWIVAVLCSLENHMPVQIESFD